MNFCDKEIDQDILAECIAASLVEKNKDIDDIFILPESQFKRGFRKDILKRDLFKTPSGKKLEVFSVCRDGLYDYLPEGIFHENHTVGLYESSDKSRENIQRTQIEEQEARKFFSAFEREFYKQRILLDLEERKNLQVFTDDGLKEFFWDFWGLPDDLGENGWMLLHIIPLCFRFVGKYDVIAECMSVVLGVDVSIKQIHPHTQKLSEDFSPILGNTKLGVDFVVGGGVNDGIPALQISLGPLDDEDIPRFLPGGDGRELLKTMCDFLVPVEMETEINMLFTEDAAPFVMGEDESSGRLGYSTFI